MPRHPALRVGPRPASVASPRASRTRPRACRSLNPRGSSKRATRTLSWPSRRRQRPSHLFPVGRWLSHKPQVMGTLTSIHRKIAARIGMAARINYDNPTRLPLTLSGAYLRDNLDDEEQQRSRFPPSLLHSRSTSRPAGRLLPRWAGRNEKSATKTRVAPKQSSRRRYP
jgi:hypothetical protein